ncbi:MAG TPA: HD domain-containing phosphohydrolase [Vicinamibacterales bacterium]
MRTTIATLAMVATVLTAVFVGVALNVRDRVRAAVTDKLEASQRTLSELEQRRARELSVQVATLAESPTLKTAVASHMIEMRSKDSKYQAVVLNAIDRELNVIASRTSLDVLAATDVSGTVLAVAGRRNADWPRQSRVLAQHAEHGGSGSAYVSMPTGVFQFASAPLSIQGTPVGTLQLGKALDERYARELSTLSGAATLISAGNSVVATTLPAQVASGFTPQTLSTLSTSSIVTVKGLEYATRLLYQDGDTRVYALDSIGESTRAPMQSALRAMLIFAICSFALAAVASFWLARTISRPIDTLSKSLSEMTSSRDFDNPLPATGISLEVDTLTATFNTMMRSVSTAEAERRGTYVGAIKALAMALDARDPYTAGHSERVSNISELIGRQMNLPEDQIEVLRLGALLHDIGKIGISDAVLRKPGPLTPEEYTTIREHPTMGARILRSVPFLAPHIPIVELHHERPDGEGYPHRLRGSETPVLARIVHVADAFDAITSARAYRRARGSSQALRELWRYAGTQFDTEVVQALTATMPQIEGTTFGDLEKSAASMNSSKSARLTLVGPTAPRKLAGGRLVNNES